ncbi:MAG: F0F1 ATP synthase subunit gamma, partial [Gemmatimonadota bacterium]|nr:F0F1 ATP synthase subunit gamma [Gemmatimonadota bacterium]
AMSTPPRLLQLLPVQPPAGGRSLDSFILSPSAGEIIERLLPEYLRNSVYRALVENAAGEQGARRAAMKNATDNAGDMLENLTRSYNRARQAQITQEIAEIVGGAAALE